MDLKIDILLTNKEVIKNYIKDFYIKITTIESATDIWSLETVHGVIGDCIFGLNTISEDNVIEYITKIIIILLTINCDNKKTVYDKIMTNKTFTILSHGTGKGFIEICLLYIAKKLNPAIKLTLLCIEFTDFGDEPLKTTI